MEGATHFIECWYSDSTGVCYQVDALPIKYLDIVLSETKNEGYTTYAIIYIKEKK